MKNYDLGKFIRTHRERVRPEDAGLRTTARRRTPGLRREELAQLCAVSPTWITWLEQGRPVTASIETLAAMADALRLTGAERQYLFTLAGKLDPAVAPDNIGGAEAILNSLIHINTPAYVLDRQWNALSWNEAAQDLFAGWLDQENAVAPNLLRYTFLSPRARALICNWDHRARRLVAEFRADCGRHLDDTAVQPLITDLCQSSKEFAAYWQDYDVTTREGGMRQFQHPQRGLLAYEQTTFHAAVRGDLKLVMLLPLAS
ncbi:helix-turn-helix transcriptional regulator [Undibacterium sp.]|jgi:transcriptional regulator with XRE-family HTH domain|uniref:helix-turn-helix transcriptional regulator n=1 Tax=Undibacterium sp. TaxID=1914977 RepID=UPI002D18F04F|nr:helix-turn-helix transcriptional regulator [Undibacterium sp.]HTD05778.1 helix-turn-helix transcriptional regulator [Undibacterium sp.]